MGKSDKVLVDGARVTYVRVTSVRANGALDDRVRILSKVQRSFAADKWAQNVCLRLHVPCSTPCQTKVCVLEVVLVLKGTAISIGVLWNLLLRTIVIVIIITIIIIITTIIVVPSNNSRYSIVPLDLEFCSIAAICKQQLCARK